MHGLPPPGRLLRPARPVAARPWRPKSDIFDSHHLVTPVAGHDVDAVAMATG